METHIRLKPKSLQLAFGKKGSITGSIFLETSKLAPGATLFLARNAALDVRATFSASNNSLSCSCTHEFPSWRNTPDKGVWIQITRIQHILLIPDNLWGNSGYILSASLFAGSHTSQRISSTLLIISPIFCSFYIPINFHST
jgi:hypothetical protein